MADALEKQVEGLLEAGESKKSILDRLATDKNHSRLCSVLNNKALLIRRRRYMWVNLALAAALLYVNLKRLLAISAAGHFDFYLLADFIVPTINFYVLKEILLFQRIGYQFLAVLTTLALIYPENRMLPDLLIHMCMIAAALFLVLRLFPKNEFLPGNKKSR